MTRPCAFCGDPTGTQSAQQIAAWFNAQGARPRSKRGTTNFTKATITDMLANRFYTGVVSYRGEGRVVFAPWEIAA